MYFCGASFQGHFRTTEELGCNDTHHQTALRVYFSYRSKTLDIYLMVCAISESLQLENHHDNNRKY